MTLSDLGVALGISHQQLQKYETGANRMSAGMLHRVANVFSLPIAELFEGAGGNKASEPDSVQKARRACHSLIDRTDSAKKLTEVSRVLKALLD
jgi:transcriptional regulator with XRE-family HTH domain